MNIALKRIHDPAESGDGKRVLVDRIWPRGISKTRAGLDFWFKEIAPSTELRQWFSHDPVRWEEFKQRYRAELEVNPSPVRQLLALTRAEPVTLLYAAADREHNNAVFLREYLLECAS